MNKIITLIKDRPLEAIIAIATIATVLVAYQANRISQQANTINQLEVSQSPKLIYSVSIIGETGEEEAIKATQNELENMILQAVLNRAAEYPNESYTNMLDTILPIRIPVAFSPSSVAVRVTNTGSRPATRVRINIEPESEINEVKVFTNETYNIIERDPASKQAVVEIDRLTPNTSADIIVTFQVTGSTSKASLVAERSSGTFEIFDLSGLSPEELESQLEAITEYLRERTNGQVESLAYPIRGVIIRKTTVTDGVQDVQQDIEVEERIFVDTPITYALYRPTTLSPKVSVTSNEVTGEKVE